MWLNGRQIATILFSFKLFSCVLSAKDVESQQDAFSYLSQNLKNYLAQFGYVDESVAQDHHLVDLQSSLIDFQRKNGLDATGIMDSKTIELMNSARCGNPDTDLGSRSKRHNFNGGRWEKREITYRISQYTTQLDPNDIHRDVSRAFRMWEKNTNLNFRELYRDSREEADIDLRFATFDHGDPGKKNNFDGKGRILGHAFRPGPDIGGDVHFDDSEEWTVDKPRGINLLSVAVHEIGHALGMSHTSEKGAIMAQFYTPYDPNLQLGSDDIAGIQTLYGIKYYNSDNDNSARARTHIRRPTAPPPPRNTPFNRRLVITAPTTTTTTTTTVPPRRAHGRTQQNIYYSASKLCSLIGNDQNFKFDAITTIGGDTIYLFKDDDVYQLSSKGEGVITGWPKKISDVFHGLHGRIDAAVTLTNGKTYFFKGEKYWRFTGTKEDASFPRTIEKQFSGIPAHIDAVFEWPHDNRLYFFKGDQYWALDLHLKSKPTMDSKYPLSIGSLGVWRGTPSIDAAFVAPNGKTYLFMGKGYHRLEKNLLHVDNPSMKPTAGYWFQCSHYKPLASEI